MVMEDFSEQSRFDDNRNGYDGEEQFQGRYEHPPEQQFDSGREFYGGNNNNVDSEGNEFRDSSSSSRTDAAAGKLFVGGVSWETSEETFTNYFSKFGEVEDSVIMLDKHTGRPRGFGFIKFADPVAADAVFEREHAIDGRVVEVKRTVPREEIGFKGGSKGKKVFVGGIPASLSDEELEEYFSTFGSIVEHQIMVDHKTGRSRGFGFVTFENEDALDKIFSEGKIHELGGKKVEVKRAEPRRSGDFSGSSARSYVGAAAGYGGYNSGGRSNRKLGRGYDETGGYAAAYGNYNNYAGNYAANYAGFYGGYGGYGYGYGFGGPMYGDAGYGASGHGLSGGYGVPFGYGGGKGYESSSADRAQGRGRDRGGSNYNAGRRYDKTDDSSTARYHPYQK